MLYKQAKSKMAKKVTTHNRLERMLDRQQLIMDLNCYLISWTLRMQTNSFLNATQTSRAYINEA